MRHETGDWRERGPQSVDVIAVAASTTKLSQPKTECFGSNNTLL